MLPRLGGIQAIEKGRGNMKANDTPRKSRNDPPRLPRRNSLLRGGASRLVLKLLRGGEGSGFALISRLEQRGCGFFRRQEAAIYPILHYLERKGLVRARRHVGEDGRIRRCYRLTAKGMARLKKQESSKAWEEV